MDDSALVRYALAQVRGKGSRGASERLGGISRTTIAAWRKKVRAGKEIALEEPTREKLLLALEAVPAAVAPDYAAGIRVGLAKVERLAEELRALAATSDAAGADEKAVKKTAPRETPKPKRRQGQGGG